MVIHEGVIGEIMEGVMNLDAVNVVWHFLNKQQKYADELWQEYVENGEGYRD
jgi:hypothetical protein